MRAIPNLGRSQRVLNPSSAAQRVSRLFLAVCALLLCASPGGFLAQGASPAADRIHAIYAAAKKAHAEAPDDAEAGWKFARACFDCADIQPSRRAAFGEEGIAASRAALRVKPDSGPAYYYLSMNLGQLARTRSLGALKLVDEMEAALLKAIELEPTFDHAGPHRTLGLLYRDAPGWPISIGSESKARKHLERIVALSPSYPENPLCLIEAYLEWNDRKWARELLPQLRRTLSHARDKLTGPEWELRWADWDARMKKVEQRFK